MDSQVIGFQFVSPTDVEPQLGAWLRHLRCGSDFSGPVTGQSALQARCWLKYMSNTCDDIIYIHVYIASAFHVHFHFER